MEKLAIRPTGVEDIVGVDRELVAAALIRFSKSEADMTPDEKKAVNAFNKTDAVEALDRMRG